MLLNLIIFLLALSVLVIVHEFGHFIAARILGVSVEKFAIGFPPKIWSKKFGETEFKINALPLGGYVSLRGEGDEENEKSIKDRKNLLSRSPLENLFIFVAGVFMNFVLGIFLLWIAFMIGTQPIIDGMPEYKGLINTQQTIIVDVEQDTPAQREGLQKGDVIKKLDGQKIYNDREVLALIQSKINEEGARVDLVVDRNGQELQKTISTYKSTIAGRNNQEIEVNRIGIILNTEGEVKASPFDALKVAILEAFRIIKLTFIGIVGLFQTLVTRFQVSPDVAGPVGVYVASTYFAQLGLTAYIQFAAVISLTLALFNILPIPALDGGQIFFTLIEVVTKRKFSHKAKNIIQLIGFGLLIGLMVAVTIKDIIRFF